MRVLVYASDNGRCGHRLIWPVEALRAQGADIGIATRGDATDVEAFEDADVLVMQRPMHRRFVPAVRRLQADGMTVVVDIDDDFSALDRRNAVWGGVHPSRNPDVNWHHLRAMCAQADLVTVTTPALARRYGAHGRVAIVPNHVPAWYLNVLQPVNPRIVVGWTGLVATHPGDLQVTRRAVSKAVEASGAVFATVGRPDGVQANLGLSQMPLSVGTVPIDVYPLAMSRFDIGIVPLEPSAFNEAKSALKGLEFAALGVPFVASDTGPYRALPVGRIARKPRDWERALRELIGSADLRAEMAGVGREWAAGETIEGNCQMWWDVWTAARDRAGRRRAVLV